MDSERFEKLVRSALKELPKDICAQLENVDVIVEERHKEDQLGGVEIDEENLLLGLYEGVPLALRDDYNMVLPDKITLFKEPIEKICENDEEVAEEVRKTVLHEVAHHFGISDDRLEELGI